MKNLLSKTITKIMGRNYIHIPKNKTILKICKYMLNVERVRGRGRNWKAIAESMSKNKNPYLLRSLRHDGDIPKQYASYLYLKIR